jgi:biotin transport system substrate-specific component
MASDVATSHRPLIDPAIPQSGAARWIVLPLLALAGTAILYLSARVAVPIGPVPVTLQTLAVLLIGAVYGWRLGLATVVLYLVEGAVGLPVFAGGGGLAYMLGPTGGFLIGFAAAAALIGWLVERGAGRAPQTLFLAMLAADALIFVLGFAWLATLFGPATAWTAGVVPFVLGDLFKVTIAALLVPAAAGLVRR